MVHTTVETSRTLDKYAWLKKLKKGDKALLVFRGILPSVGLVEVSHATKTRVTVQPEHKETNFTFTRKDGCSYPLVRDVCNTRGPDLYEATEERLHLLARVETAKLVHKVAEERLDEAKSNLQDRLNKLYNACF